MKPVYKTEAVKKQFYEFTKELLTNWPVEWESRFIETTYGTTHVIESGDDCNPKLVLLHGSSTNSLMWAGDVEILSKKYHVLCIDIIG